jgi:hypothetical protein
MCSASPRDVAVLTYVWARVLWQLGEVADEIEHVASESVEQVMHAELNPAKKFGSKISR